jgi:hypothetical protein
VSTGSPDNVPQPRCLVLQGSQQLSVTNSGNVAITATIGSSYRAAVPPSETVTFPEPVGARLAPGVHLLVFGNGAATEVWVDPVCKGPGVTNCSTP